MKIMRARLRRYFKRAFFPLPTLLVRSHTARAEELVYAKMEKRIHQSIRDDESHLDLLAFALPPQYIQYCSKATQEIGVCRHLEDEKNAKKKFPSCPKMCSSTITFVR